MAHQPCAFLPLLPAFSVVVAMVVVCGQVVEGSPLSTTICGFGGSEADSGRCKWNRAGT